MNLSAKVNLLPGVGPKMAEKLKRLGIETIRDLIFYWPRAWLDFSSPRKIASLRIDEDVIIHGEIKSVESIRSPKKWLSIIKANLADETGEIKVVWFNQSFLTNTLKEGDEWFLAGRVGWDFKNKCKTFSPTQMEKVAKILPLYPLTEGLTHKFLRKIIEPQLKKIETDLEYLPEEILKEQELLGLKEAIQNIHFPQNNIALERAKVRLAFDELFLIALRFLTIKKELQQNNAPNFNIEPELLKDFTINLPYKLTDAQRKAAWQIIKDLNRSIPMNRLLEGDVGSGKTVVAAMAALVAIKNGFQTVWLAPTEILATQHFQNICQLFSNQGIKIGLITSGVKKIYRGTKGSDQDHENNNSEFIINNSELIIGTHALIQKSVHIPNLGLIIIDEQHRFGVKQRAYLRQQSDLSNRTSDHSNKKIDLNAEVSKPKSESYIPHLLSMTATPIPRTLALALYGDLDISIIDELPKGRQKIITKIIQPKEREKTYQLIENEIRNGRQAFVICPLIENGEQKTENGKLFDMDKKSAVAEHEKLSKKIFPHLKIGLLHGRLKSKEKEAVMLDFKNKKIDILVSTAVVEVGIDIPNATVMMIESAERFGLAQLHQFRGRVGRGQYQSYCFLFSESDSQKSKQRLEAMEKSNNGFELAQFDLEQRGPGEIIGLIQSGAEDLKMAKLTDTINLSRARQAAEKIINADLEKYPALCAKLKEFEVERHLE